MPSDDELSELGVGGDLDEDVIADGGKVESELEAEWVEFGVVGDEDSGSLVVVEMMIGWELLMLRMRLVDELCDGGWIG